METTIICPDNGALTTQVSFVGFSITSGAGWKQSTKTFQEDVTPTSQTEEPDEFNLAVWESRKAVNHLRDSSEGADAIPDSFGTSLESLHKIFKEFLKIDTEHKLTIGAVLDLGEHDVNGVIDNIARRRRIDFSIKGESIEVALVTEKKVFTREFGLDEYLSLDWIVDFNWLNG